jgi:hypothetical protein
MYINKPLTRKTENQSIRRFYVQDVRNLRQAPDVGEDHLSRPQREQQDFLPEPADYKAGGRRYAYADQDMYEVPQGHG